MSIEYRKGDLFSAPTGVALVQACNCQGVWGAGVAAQFKKRFKYSFSEYKYRCSQLTNILGTSMSTWDQTNGGEYLVASLFTSSGFGSSCASLGEIVRATDEALYHLAGDKNLRFMDEIHSPKINAGLFNVPWKETESIIEKHLPALGKKWVVWELT